MQLPLANLRSPRREKRHKNIEPYQHIDKPQMTCGIVEIKQQPFQILYRLTINKGIYQRPQEQTRKNTQSPALEKTQSISLCQRKEQIRGGYHKERHARRCNPFKNTNPNSIGRRGNQRTLTSKKKRLRTMNQHNHKTRRNPHPIQPNNTLPICYTLHTVGTAGTVGTLCTASMLGMVDTLCTASMLGTVGTLHISSMLLALYTHFHKRL